MGKEFQKSALPTLFHFVRVRAAFQPHVKKNNIQFRMSQKLFEILTPKFHQLLASLGTCFVQNMKVLGGQQLDFMPKEFKKFNGYVRTNF